MIRPYQDSDHKPVVKFWWDAMEIAMPGLAARSGYTYEGAQEYFKDVIVKENDLWVYELNKTPVGFIAFQNEFIDRLYVSPTHHRQGIGQVMLDFAFTLSPKHLWLYTHQKNTMARAFYEKNNFIAEKFGVSLPPESEPDIEYHWRFVR